MITLHQVFRRRNPANDLYCLCAACKGSGCHSCKFSGLEKRISPEELKKLIQVNNNLRRIALCKYEYQHRDEIKAKEVDEWDRW